MSQELEESKDKGNPSPENGAAINTSTQAKFIWKNTKYDGILPITKFVKGVQETDPNKMYREDKSKNDKGCTIKITTFVNHKAKESIIQSSNIIEELKKAENPGEEQKHEGSEKALSEHEQGEDEQEEMEEEPQVDTDSVHVGDNIFLINQNQFASIKSCIEDTLFECDVKGDPQMLMLAPFS